ncbi:hypothetical protein QFC21_003524 [Naganishia friedmannii]|uniref:Uncharacterized protein n=1 Tax=Naganishia friedmannii TaxID=89922 RepID=A0ACC2VNL1_9TREE|nr:hypothetical protein QFC21_003524 [Naganishia friedmannii]
MQHPPDPGTPGALHYQRDAATTTTTHVEQGEIALGSVSCDGMQFWVNKRNLTSGNPRDVYSGRGALSFGLNANGEGEATGGGENGASSILISAADALTPTWRLRSRLKTFAAALVLCLNLGVDPPDIVKTTPCAKLECWVDPAPLPANKALEGIGRNLQQQYETLSPKVRYKQHLDPSVEETKKFCVNLRRSAKDERVLMHYNGHGVPKPTTSGEIWVFNKSDPCIFVWECSAAGNIVSNFNRMAERRDKDHAENGGRSSGSAPEGSEAYQALHGGGANGTNGTASATNGTAAANGASPAPAGDGSTTPGGPTSNGQTTYTPFMECIHLAACQADQILPMTPELPADLFTCCLTSPIEIALRFFVLQDPLRINTQPGDPKAKITLEMVMKIPGDLKDRRTPLGELNWIFTAVTDTIAWLVFPRDVFKRLFRQDLLVAALFRNFLLAERVMRAYHCTPISHPPLPATHNHPLWASWDLAVEACLDQLPALLDAVARTRDAQSGGQGQGLSALGQQQAAQQPLYTYQPSRFFAEHLQAFEIWLQHGGAVSSSHLASTSSPDHLALARRPPDQLPIVLQVLLSQTHRLRALILLSKFVDLGPWAVNLALSIGIFPYVQKLLQSPAVDLKPVLIFIWTRILAVDRSCQVDLLKDSGFTYFSRVLAPPSPQTPPLLIPNASEHRAMCAFILSMVCRGFRQGQVACMNNDVFKSCFTRVESDDWLLKQWSALCIAQMWADGYDAAKMMAIKEGYQDQLIFMLKDESAEVRAAAMYAIGTLLGASGMSAESGEKGSDPKGGGGTGSQMEMTERQQLKLETGVAQACVLQTKEDASPLVRKELVVVLSCVAREWRGWFVCAAWMYHEEDARQARQEMGGAGVEKDPLDGSKLVTEAMQEWGQRTDIPKDEHRENSTMMFIFKLMYTTLLDLSVDPHPEVASLACTVLDYLTALLLDSAFTRAEGSTLRIKQYKQRTSRFEPQIPTTPGIDSPSLSASGILGSPGGILSVSPEQTTAPSQLKRTDTGITAALRMSGALKRNSSIANALKNLATITGYGTPQEDAQSVASEDSQALKQPPLNTAQSQLHVQPYIPPYPMKRTETSTSVLTKRAKSQDRISRTASLGSLLHSSRADFGFSSMHEEDHKKPKPFSAADVVHALTEEDMERLRIRRFARTEAGGGAELTSNNKGMPKPNELGLGMVANEVKDDVLPLRSEFYDYSLEYFKEPQMKIPDADEPGNVMYNEQIWRSQRNQRMLESTRGEDAVAINQPWTKSVGILHNDSWPSILEFHAFEPHLAVADEADNICIWDWQNKQRLSRFSVGGTKGSSVSSMHFVNETAASLLLTASTDGNIHIFREYDQPGGALLASAFRGLVEKHPGSRRSGVVTSWEQRTGHLLVGGDSRFIRAWDARIEYPIFDFPTQAGSNCTSITSDYFGGHVFVAGFGDGVIRIFDKRLGEDRAIVRVIRQHHTWIKSVSMQKGDGAELVTGSINGDIKIWDIRSSDIPISAMNASANGLSAVAVHDQAPLFATTSSPYTTSSAYGSSTANASGGIRKGQRLNVYRIEHKDESSPDLNAFDSGRYTPSGVNGAVLKENRRVSGNGYPFPSIGATDVEGPQPVCLSSTLLRGDVGNAIGLSGGSNAASASSGQAEAMGRDAQGNSRRKWGVHQNALTFHPHALVLAVGGFDHNHGNVRLISYDKPKNSSATNGDIVRQWE